MDWEYKITNSSLWYNVYRRKEEDWRLIIEWLQKDTYTLNRDFARTFYHIQDAESALVVERARWRKGITSTTSIKESESEEHKEKTSWSEL